MWNDARSVVDRTLSRALWEKVRSAIQKTSIDGHVVLQKAEPRPIAESDLQPMMW